jgi:MFS family permease
MQTLKTFSTLFLLLLINAVVSGLFTPLSMEILIKEAHLFAIDEQLGRAAIDIMYGTGLTVALSSAYFFCSPILGLYSDIYGRKKIFKSYLICAFFAYSIIWVGLQIHSITIILFGALLQGISMGILPLVQAATADISHRDKRSFYFGMLNIYMVGFVLATQLGSYLLTLNADHTKQIITFMLIAMSLLQIMSFFIVIRYLPETLKTPVQRPTVISYNIILANLAALFSQRYTRWILFLLLLFQFAWGIYFEDMFTYLTREIHFSALNVSLFISYTVIIIAISLLCFYPMLTRKMSLTGALILNFSICCIGLLGCGLFTSVMGQWISIIPFALGVAMLNPVLWTLLLNTANAPHYGLLMGIASPLCAATWLFSDIAGDFLNAYSLELPIDVSTVVMVACLIFAVYISKYILGKKLVLTAEKLDQNELT